MTEVELRDAIAKPAANAGFPFEEATINLLVEQSRDREGALPLLQFALTRIWEGLGEGAEPADTLKRIGGVGGALAGEAERLYNKLNERQKAIARRAFLEMVQLGEGARDTRRRIKLSQVVAQSEDVEQVQQVLQLFSAQTARLVTLAGDEEGARTAEVTHEALLEHWHSLNAWLDSSRDDLRFQRRLEEAACHWEKQKRPRGLLWRSPDLETLRDFYRRKGEEMTARQVEFYRACERAKKVGAGSDWLCLLPDQFTALESQLQPGESV
jgi:hypothetical protein